MSNIFKIAENLLNNLDQSTQSSIQTAMSKTPNPQGKQTKKQKQSNNLNLDYSSAAPVASSLSASSSYANLKQNSSSHSLNNLSAEILKSSSKSTKNKDDELIDFLNNPNSLEMNSSKSSSKSNLDKTDNLGWCLLIIIFKISFNCFIFR